jgi:hypothetical protein
VRLRGLRFEARDAGDVRERRLADRGGVVSVISRYVLGLASAASLLGLAIVACSDGDFEVVPPASGRASPLDSGANARPATEPTPPCEAAVVGAACPNDPVVCETGDHANPACNARIRCSGITWKNDTSAASCAEGCPTAPAFDLPDACAAPNASSLRCEYADDRTTCGCAPARDSDAGDAGDGGGSTYVWKCVQASAGCPATRPHVGAPCVRPMTCDYGTCFFDEAPVMRCTGGFWELDPPASCEAP